MGVPTLFYFMLSPPSRSGWGNDCIPALQLPCKPLPCATLRGAITPRSVSACVPEAFCTINFTFICFLFPLPVAQSVQMNKAYVAWCAAQGRRRQKKTSFPLSHTSFALLLFLRGTLRAPPFISFQTVVGRRVLLCFHPDGWHRT